MVSMNTQDTEGVQPTKSESVEREETTLKFWNTHKIFQKTLEKESPRGEFVFYEGPPTANAKPALHHLEARSFKDIIPRYKTMRGFHVRRKGGWDTHGLPVELQIEKKLGLQSKKDIEKYGIVEFNKQCKESVFEYISLWADFTDRIGYWVDKENAYYTFNASYIESVWNILKTVDDKKLLYKDYKVLPWCPRCGTALSSHELAQGYQDDKDLSVTAKFKIKGFPNAYFLAWTTTPWTLPGNVALAVGPDIVYVEAKVGTDIFVLAKDRLSVITEPYEILAEHTGTECVGMEYEPLYPFMQEKFEKENPESFAKAYKVYTADFVNTTDGTGIVHTAVMYGQDDFVFGTQIGLPKYHLVKDDGHYFDGMDFLSGRFVKDEEVAVDVIKDLAHRGLLFKKEKYEHSYPHCWRCKTPLIYYARDSWYIRMSSLRDKLVKENEEINWEPSHIKEGRFGEWLREIKDWAISRERYWGTPLPIWFDVKGEKTIIGSIEELKKYTKKSGNTYFVMRHGETESNVKSVWNCDSHETNPLTENGVRQVKESAQSLVHEVPDIILCSPYPRTKETAHLVAKTLGVDEKNILTDERLGEWSVGMEFNDKPIQSYFDIRNKSNKLTFKTADGESYEEVLKRSAECIYDIDQKYSGKKILIVSHGAPVRALFLVAQGYTKEGYQHDIMHFDNFRNAEIRKLDFVPLPHNENFELDLHRPYIDSVELVDENGEKLTRVKEVVDVWFDSGAMPFAQDHYPFENKKYIETSGYPADFISEAIDQTRGWFYTLHAIGILSGRGKAYKNVICLGHILDAQGKKMSKSIGNIVDPWLMMDKYGVDALRLWMYSVNQPGDSKNFDEKTVDEIVKKVFNPLLNVLAFYDMYTDVSVTPHNKSEHVLDRWILSKLNELLKSGSASLDKFQVFEAARLIRDFVNDFSAWYIRRSRDRFKSFDKKEKENALATTGFVLFELAKYMAPFTPFFAEHLYQKTKKEGDVESVHLCVWPFGGDIDETLISDMYNVREVVTRALELRQKAGVKVRQPLASLSVSEKFTQDLLDIIADEINVKKVFVSDSQMSLDTHITTELKEEGIIRDIIRGIQDMRKQENLEPYEPISIIISTDKEIEKLCIKYTSMLSGPTLVTNVIFSPEKQKYEVVLEGHIFSVSR